MRILKRNLAFVLVLVMALSLTVSAANVNDYKDANDVTYVEAVDVMTALGILQGEDGVFNPQNTLTREQGAKIIAYMMLGKNAADKLTTSVAPFADVAANRWSAGYVAYCANKGIIGGYGDGNFGPNDQLTATQFAKMLLCAVGYGVNGEFSGNGWESAVNSTALVNGVFEGNDELSLSAACTREEAALYAFNTLTAVLPVQYSKAFDCYYTGTVLNSVDKNTNGWEKYTLAKTLYNMEKVTKNGDDPVTDDFGRVCHFWKQGNKETTKFYDAPKATYTKEVTSKAIYADLGLTEDKVTAKVFVDGKAAADFDLTKAGPDALPKSGNGVAVEAFVGKDDKGKTTVTLIVVNTYLAQVTNVKDGTVTVDLYNAPDTAEKTFKTSVAFAEKDYVLVTLAYDKANDKYTIQSMVEAEQVTGKLEAVADKYVKVDGTKYFFSKNLDKAKVFTKDYDATMSVILDENGYLIGLVVKTAAEVKNEGYVQVVDCQYNPTSLLASKAAVVKVMHLDGTGYEILPLPTRVNKDGEDEVRTAGGYVVLNGDTKKVANGFYGYSMDDNGCIVLRKLDDSDETPTELGFKGDIAFDGSKSQKGTFTAKTYDDKNNVTGSEKVLDGKYMNAKTEVVLVSKDKAETITGYKNVKLANENVNILVVYSGDTISKVYVVNGATQTAPVYAYYNGEKEEVATGTYALKLYVNGEAKTYKEGNEKLEKGAYNLVTSGDELTKDTKPVETTEVKVTAVTSTGFKYENDTVSVSYADEAKVFDLTDDGAEGTVAKGDTVAFKLNKDGLVDYAWVIKHN